MMTQTTAHSTKELYPYLSTIRKTTLYHNVISLNILRPYQIDSLSLNRQAYVLQTIDNISLVEQAYDEHQDHTTERLICSQPIYSQVIALKKVRHQFIKDGCIDMLFMMTKDLSMSLIHFNKTLGKLEVVSTYKIDPSIITGQGRQLTEVTYITYDRASQTLIAVFSSSYVLTLNLSELQKSESHQLDCECPSHLSINNFTLQEIESKEAVEFKRVTIGSKHYLAGLYDRNEDERYVDPGQSQYNIMLYQIWQHDEGNDIISTDLFKNTSIVNLDVLRINQQKDHVNQFYRLTFSKGNKELIILSEEGIFLFTIDFPPMQTIQRKRGQVNSLRFVPFEEQIEHMVSISEGSYLLVTENASLYHFTPASKTLDEIDSCQLPSPYLSSAFSLSMLSSKRLLACFENANHQIIDIKFPSQEVSSLVQQSASREAIQIRQIENIGSICQVSVNEKEGQKRTLMLNKSREKSRVFQIGEQSLVDGIGSYKTDQDIENMWGLPQERLLLQYFLGMAEIWELENETVSRIELPLSENEVIINAYEQVLITNQGIYSFNNENSRTPLLSQSIQSAIVIEQLILYINSQSQELCLYSIATSESRIVFASSDEQYIRSFSASCNADKCLVLISFWNQSSITLMEIGFNGRVISHEGQLDISKFGSIEGRGIDGLKVITVGDKEKLLVILNDGVLLVFSFYGVSLQKIKELGFFLESLIQLDRILKVGEIIFSISDLKQTSNGDSLVFVTSDVGTYLLRFEEGELMAKKVKELEGVSSIASGLNREYGLSLDRQNILIFKTKQQQHFISEVINFSKTVQKFDYLPEEDLLCICSFDSSQTDQPHGPQFQVVRASTGRVVFSQNLAANQKPSAVKHIKLDEERTLIYFGVTIQDQLNLKRVPQQGSIYPILLKKKPNGKFIFGSHTSTSVEGAVIDFEYYHSENGNHCLLVGVNDRVLIYKMDNAYFDKNYTLENSDLLHMITSQIFIYKLKLTGKRLYVADIMKSLTVYNIVEDGEIVEATMDCRDPRGSWALDLAQTSFESLLVSDFKKNLVQLSKSTVAEKKVFEIQGAYQLSQQVNCIENNAFGIHIENKNERKSPSDVFTSSGYLQSQDILKGKSFYSETTSFSVEMSPNHSLLATSDGALLVVTYIKTKHTFEILKALQNEIAQCLMSFGYPHPACKQPKVLEDDPEASLYLYGDLIESLFNESEEQILSIINKAMGKIDSTKYGNQFGQQQIREVVESLRHCRQ